MASAANASSLSGEPVIGANVNGGTGILNANGLVERSETTHIRARLDIRRKINKGKDPNNDDDVEALQDAAREHGCTLIISLLWDFDGMFGKPSVSVPDPGSDRARKYRRYSAKYLRALGDDVEVVVFGNEPMWETQDDDLTGDPAPFVRFIDNVQTHLDRHADLPSNPAYLVGSLNRLYDEPVRNNNEQFLDQMYSLANGDEFHGLDLHVHYDGLDEAREMIRIGRDRVPNGLITVTEFSPVHRYRHNMDTEFGDSERGKAFAAEYGYDQSTTMFEYFRAASNNPRPHDEIEDFYRAMPWYNIDHIKDIRALFQEFDVAFGGLAFAHGYRARDKHFDSDWRQWPFHINDLFEPGIMKAPDGIKSAPHPHYMDDYRSSADGSISGSSSDGSSDDGPLTFDAGMLTFDENRQDVSVDDHYYHPVIVAPSLSYAGPQPAHVRITDFANRGFEARVEEWGYLDGWHRNERAGYLMFDTGIYTSGNGKRIEAGRSRIDENWQSVSFEGTFGETPALFTSSQSTHGSQPVVTRARNVSGAGFEYRLQEEEAKDDWHREEMTGWLALERGQGTLNGRRYEAGHATADYNWRHIEFDRSYANPTFLADVTSFQGPNPIGVRFRNLTADGVDVHLEEDQSADSETWHTNETVSYVVIEG